jgi:sortase A
MNRSLILKISAVVSGISGMIIIIGTIYPIVSYQAMSKSKFPTLLSPIPTNTPAPMPEDFDYTRASNWFVGGAKEGEFSLSKVSFYTLSIPRLKIEGAAVAIGGEDLSDTLIQYPGTALPGKTGNAVIFGHSILPQFYNPKDYLAIFSTLPTLSKGDEINIDYDGVAYLYRVEDMFEVAPTDIQVLEQDRTDSFLTLVTCTPPGDPRKPKRLIVRARIVAPETANANTRS